jgi:subtilisin family serine protease
VDIISMSFGVGEENDRITDAVRYAYSKNVAIYAAAAYDGARTAVAYPARLQEVFCIHACDGAGNKATFSPSPETIGNNFSMLGVSVLSTWPDFRKIDGDAETTRSSNLIQPNKMPGTWKYASGTSMATPLAVALAANVLAYTRVNSHRLPSLQKYDTLRRTFLGMGKLSGDFRTVMPWEGLNSQFKDTIKQGPSDVFHDQLKAAMRNIW